jgi:hypothetical protein
MRKALFWGLGLLVCFSPARAQRVETLKTGIDDIGAYDPVPSNLSEAETSFLNERFKIDFASNIKLSRPEDAKAWKKHHDGGYIICVTFPPLRPGGRALAIVESITTGVFKATQQQYLWDAEAYNLVGCNTPSATALSP